MEAEPVESYEHCSKAYYEPCRLHPVNCDNCRSGSTCQMRQDKKAHPDVFKSCKFYRPIKKGLEAF
jgi:hypothetical protein